MGYPPILYSVLKSRRLEEKQFLHSLESKALRGQFQSRFYQSFLVSISNVYLLIFLSCYFTNVSPNSKNSAILFNIYIFQYIYFEIT